MGLSFAVILGDGMAPFSWGVCSPGCYLFWAGGPVLWKLSTHLERRMVVQSFTNFSWLLCLPPILPIDPVELGTTVFVRFVSLFPDAGIGSVG